MSCDQTQKISIFELILNLTLAKKKKKLVNMAKKARNQSHTVSKIQNFFFGGGGGACPQTPIECCVVNFGSYIWYK